MIVTLLIRLTFLGIRKFKLPVSYFSLASWFYWPPTLRESRLGLSHSFLTLKRDPNSKHSSKDTAPVANTFFKINRKFAKLKISSVKKTK